MSRLQWLVSHPEFKRDPVRVMRGVVSWEIHKLLSKNMSLELDGDQTDLPAFRWKRQAHLLFWTQV